MKLGDYGAVWALPLALRSDMMRVEVRAFGCLIDDMLANNNGHDDGLLVTALRGLADNCMQEVVHARPSLDEVVAKLAALAKGLF